MSAGTPRGGLHHALLMSLVAAGTTWLAMLSWRGFGESSARYLGPLVGAGAIIAVLGALLRWWRVPGPVVLLVQLVAVGGFVSRVLSGSVVPIGEHRVELVDRWQAAVEAAQSYASPVPAEVATLEPLLLPLGVVCLLLVDVVACTLRRVPLAGLALLTIYAVGVSVLAGAVPWVWFALPAGGFLVMLFLFEDEYVARWGHGVGGRDDDESDGFGVRTGAVRATAIGVGGAATALAVVLPIFIPTLQLGVFGGGVGSGGGGSVDIENPIVDLRRDLRRGDDVPLIRMATDDPAPAYLRISVLTRFNGTEWTSGDRDIPADQRADGTLPPLPGVTGEVIRTEHTYQITALDSFGSTWLPAMATSTYVDAPGNWRFDRDTMDFVAADDSTDTRGLDYTMRAVDLDLSATQLAAAPAAVGELAARYTGLPLQVPRAVRAQAQLVAGDATSEYGRAVALQNWFRRDGGFEYSLERAPEGNGSDELSAFLDERVGYCEQFASAMAVMARSLDIPARVAIGFLTPERISANGYEYTAYDLHAWPELYFPGAGWVRFEPTPGSRAPTVPTYTREEVPTPEDLGPSAGPESDATDALGNPDGASGRPDLLAEEPGSAGATSGFDWRRAGSVVGGIVLAVGLALLPGWARRWRRERRWSADPGPEAAWRELRDTALDHARPWPAGLSPQATALRVADWFGDPGDRHPSPRPPHGPDYAPHAVAALGRLVHALERSRYARSADPSSLDALREDTETVTHAIAAGAPRRARQRARWLPASLLARGARTPAGDVDVVERGGMVDHVG